MTKIHFLNFATDSLKVAVTGEVTDPGHGKNLGRHLSPSLRLPGLSTGCLEGGQAWDGQRIGPSHMDRDKAQLAGSSEALLARLLSDDTALGMPTILTALSLSSSPWRPGARLSPSWVPRCLSRHGSHRAVHRVLLSHRRSTVPCLSCSVHRRGSQSRPAAQAPRGRSSVWALFPSVTLTVDGGGRWVTETLGAGRPLASAGACHLKRASGIGHQALHSLPPQPGLPLPEPGTLKVG